MIRVSRQRVQALLVVFLLSYVAFGVHATTHAPGEGFDCVSCSSHANGPVAISLKPFELQTIPLTVFDCEHPAAIAPDDTFSSPNSRGPPQLS
jgi:hypothetical protein